MQDLRPRPPALPATADAFRALRRLKVKPNLNDMVEALHLQLYEYDGYAKLFEAIYKEDTVEGSFICDQVRAAIMLREEALKVGQEEVSHIPLAKLKNILTIVLRRYGCGRNQRLKLLEHQPTDGGANGSTATDTAGE